MVRFTGGLLLFSAVAAAAPSERHGDSSAAQKLLHNPIHSGSAPQRRLQGRFLHITDIHPDPYYKVHSSPDGEHPCHKGSGKGRAGYFGAEVTDCDTPLSLVNATFQWVKEHLKDQIDFVVWTGDSARHDNDEQLPRRDKQVIEQNELIVRKFVEVFGKTDNTNDPDPTNMFVIPIVPTFGNNDILPHNIFEPGPNKWTRKYEDIWKDFVPQEQRHSFARGGWFFSEVIPNRLAVFSLNTLYFFDSNSAVDGCDLESEPGYEHMEWLRIQLQFLRQRRMKAILIGHVPPARTESKQNWDESCYQKYTLWLRQYRDVIVSSIFGHMNIDHFMFQDVKDLNYKFKIKGVDDEFSRTNSFDPKTNDDKFSISAKATYLNELRDGWSSLPTPPRGTSYNGVATAQNSDELYVEKKKKKKGKKQKQMDKFLKEIGGPWGERFSMSIVSPSVVPNFFPTLRVVEYNITGLEDSHPALKATGIPASVEDLEFHIDDDTIDFDPRMETEEGVVHDLKKKKKKKKGKKKKPKKPTFPVPHPPSKSAVPGPAYSPQSLSLVSWTQYYANLTKINEVVDSDNLETNAKSQYKHFNYRFEYTTNNDSVYRMDDLTVRTWLDMAERIGRTTLPKLSTALSDDELTAEERGDAFQELENKGKDGRSKTKAKNHLWRTFVKRAFVNTKPENELDDQFG